MGRFFVLLFLLVCTACTERSQSEHSPIFELRDFVSERDMYYSASFTSRGILLAREESLTRGSLQVWLQYREKGNTVDRNWKDCSVIVTDGTGRVEVVKFVARDDSNVTAPEYEWRVLGYAKLSPAQLAAK